MDLSGKKVLSYRPYLKGVYQVAPLLRPFGSTSENEVSEESKIFQIDKEYPQFRETKIKSLQENPDKYFGLRDFSPEHQYNLAQFMIETFCGEHPEIFKLEQVDEKNRILHCAHSGDKLKFDENYTLKAAIGPATSTFLALALQIQEDFAAWRVDEKRDWMALGSICYPNHWAPEEKFGQNFFTVHEPIAESGPMIANSAQIVKTMINKGPFVRFAWGISTDTRLNHHPVPPKNIPFDEWWGRSFDIKDPELYVRAERQCLVGFPELDMAFFTIRTYFEKGEDIRKNPEYKAPLKEALRSMTPASLEYKGLSKSLDSIIKWLDA